MPTMWPVYVINLDRDEARLAAVGGMLDAARIGWRRIPAVNGRALSPGDVARVYDADANRRRAKHPLVAPEIGCYLSHIAAWRALAEDGAPGAVILEDDFSLTGDLGAVIAALSADPGEWDIAKLFSFRPDVPLARARPLTGATRIGFPYRVPSTTLGYAIRAGAARRLAELSLPFFRPIDEDHKFFWEKGLRVALVAPPPIRVGLEEAAEGTVGDVRKRAARADGRAAPERLWRKLSYALGYQARLHLARLGGR